MKLNIMTISKRKGEKVCSICRGYSKAMAQKKEMEIESNYLLFPDCFIHNALAKVTLQIGDQVACFMESKLDLQRQLNRFQF